MDFFGGLFGGAPAAAPADAPATDVSDPVAAPVEETPAAPSDPLLALTAAEIEGYEPAQVVTTLHSAVESPTPEVYVALIETCCKRLRVLCREPENCKRCDEAKTAAAVVAAMGALPSTASVQLQALAAIVNLCSGEQNEHRKNAVDANAMKAIVAAMTALPSNAEVQEMACIALQNCCYGDDLHALTRRQTAGMEGAIEAVIAAMSAHEASAPMQEVGAATLRLVVHKVTELRNKAVKCGAKEEWVKPIQPSGGILSFRKGFGFGTSRRKSAKEGS